MTPSAQSTGLTHACVRCGRPVSIDLALCEECNPLGLSQPAASQAHGTVLLGLVAAVVVLAVAAHVALAGIGPFRGQVAGVAPAAGGLRVTIDLTNDGSKTGSTTCTLTDTSQPFSRPTVFLHTPRVGPGATLSFTEVVVGLGTAATSLTIDCPST